MYQVRVWGRGGEREGDEEEGESNTHPTLILSAPHLLSPPSQLTQGLEYNFIHELEGEFEEGDGSTHPTLVFPAFHPLPPLSNSRRALKMTSFISLRVTMRLTATYTYSPPPSCPCCPVNSRRALKMTSFMSCLISRATPFYPVHPAVPLTFPHYLQGLDMTSFMSWRVTMRRTIATHYQFTLLPAPTPPLNPLLTHAGS